ncbi:hypothetical protein EDB81DRAFT_771141 [Dactylonectria macrodidyma]|uniref:Secreted protein n=1 Tax=Dactylonectria macrodidyma TaxID=307937 RepID=A0A9P9FRI1_9HYPO|nr:hypothetical protein EDB81DRAFT_771141 [Dactylonectria macrodidyma]
MIWAMCAMSIWNHQVLTGPCTEKCSDRRPGKGPRRRSRSFSARRLKLLGKRNKRQTYISLCWYTHADCAAVVTTELKSRPRWQNANMENKKGSE